MIEYNDTYQSLMPDFPDFLLSLVTAAGLSGLVGLEREMRLQDRLDPYEIKLGGLRTFAMMGIIGFLGMWLSIRLEMPWIMPLVFIMAFGLSLTTHLMAVYFQKYFGITSQLSLLAGFLIGILVAIHETLAAITVSILFTGLLALKNGLHRAVQKISKEDLIAILKFFILTSVVLPILPQSWIDPFGFFDWRPQMVWLMVMLVASIRFIGYFLAKFIDSDRSIFFSGIIGGFISSTAVTVAISQESKGSTKTILFLVPILFASALMFVRVLFEVTVVSGGNRGILNILAVPLSFLALLFFAAGGLLLYRFEAAKTGHKKEKTRSILTLRQPLKLLSALSFGAFFLLILLLSEKISELFSESGLYLTGAIAGLTDVDAITLAMTNLAKGGEIDIHTASAVILLAVMVNMLVKVGIVFLFGSRKLFRAVAIAVCAGLAAGVGVFAV